MHLVGYFHSCINDARIDEHETDVVLQEVVKQKVTFTANLDNSRIALKSQGKPSKFTRSGRLCLLNKM